MASHDSSRVRATRARIGRGALLVVASAICLLATMLGGIGIVAGLSSTRSTQNWQLLSNVGQAFGGLNALLSGLALLALVVTFSLQLRELRSQQAELALQRTALHRSATADLRKLHVDLIKMALDDTELAEVWPSYHEWNETRRRQYLYVNLILQNISLQTELGNLSPAQAESSLRRLFKSPLVREYWADVNAPLSSMLLPDTEFQFTQMANMIWLEYQAVVAGSRIKRSDKDHPTPTPNG
jgi:hypothetical protein